MEPGVINFKYIPPLKIGNQSFSIVEDLPGTQTTGSGNTINILETAEDYLLLINAAGMAREDISINIDQGIITVTTNRTNNPNKPVCFLKDRCIYDFPDWTRAFKLPADADVKRADATYKNGELFIHIPRGVPGDNMGSSEVYVY